jgi:LPXTG-motif cell wall-anchored protein
VTYSVADTDNYDGDTKTVTVTINPKTITEADVKLNGALTYNGKEQTQQITVTDGITYEVTGNKATKAGKYELTVKGTGNYAGTITLDWEVAKATVTITADNKVIYIGEDIPVLTYKVSGLIGDDKLIKDPTLTTNADENQAGSYTITAANADAGDNYTITYVSGALTIMDQDTEVMTRIEITELTDVPNGLKDTEFDTVDKIIEELISRILATVTGYSAENMVHYDVTWQFSLDSGETWIRAMEEHFPTEGITVILPYPEGTNARDYDFAVSHMFSVTSQRLGTTAGDVELPKVEETADGIRVTLTGLSPVTVAAKYHDHTGGTATCTDKAICTVCGTAYGELDATNHAGGTEIKNAKDATCGTEGYTGDTHCMGCGELVTKGTTIQATGEHTYGEWKVIKEATKTAKGEKQRTCSVCDHVDSEEIPMLSDIPATGDDSNIMLWGGTMVISLAALVALLVQSKKRRTAK